MTSEDPLSLEIRLCRAAIADIIHVWKGESIRASRPEVDLFNRAYSSSLRRLSRSMERLDALI